jgi:hypothetical protein
MRLTEVYLFQCAGGELYAFTVDKTGSNLPQSACKGGWLLRGQLTAADLIDAQYAGALRGTAEIQCVLPGGTIVGTHPTNVGQKR